MGKLDRLKADISFHEKMFFAALAIIIGLIGLIGWSASNFLTTSLFVLLLAFCGLSVAIVFGIYQYRFIKRLIGDLEDA